MQELIKIKQWTPCRAENRGRRPVISPGKTNGTTYDQAISQAAKSTQSSYYGFLFSNEDPYVGLDIDVDPTGQKANASLEIPPAVLFYISAYPTEVHYSPSGHGIHAIYKMDKEACEKLNELNKKQGACNQEAGALFDGDWRWQSSFLTFTDNKHELCSKDGKIAMIDFETLSSILGFETEVTVDPNDPNMVSGGSSASEDTKPAAPKKKRKKRKMQSAEKPVTVERLTELLSVVPSHFDHQAKKACKTLQHTSPESNYDYWVLIGQACAHSQITLELLGASISTEIEDVFHEWSKGDSDYNSEGECRDKYRSLVKSTEQKMASGDTGVATYKVLALLGRNAILDFPKLKGKNLIPDVARIENYKYLMTHESLTIREDLMGGGFVIMGPEPVINKWFRPRPASCYFKTKVKGISQVLDATTLKPTLLGYFQHKFDQGVSSAQTKMATEQLAATCEQSNAFKDWILSKPWDGVSRFESVCHSIEYDIDAREPLEMRIKREETYNGFIRNSLLSMIGLHVNNTDNAKINAMLVLTGPQHTYKSSWAEWLMPNEMRDYFGAGSVDMMIKGDVERDRMLSTKALVVVNECEPLFTPRYEQKLKSSVDQETVTYRRLYAENTSTKQRTALIIGTTNKPNLYTGSLGTRKIWQIPVKQCDSMLIREMDKQQLFAEIYQYLVEYKAKNNCLVGDAWATKAEEREVVEEINRLAKGTIGVDSLLIEIFGDPVKTPFNVDEYKGKNGGVNFRDGNPFDQSNRPNLWTKRALFKYINETYPEERLQVKDLNYPLINYASLFTNSKAPKINTCLTELAKQKTANWDIRSGAIQKRGSTHFLLPILGEHLETDEEDDLE